MKSWSLLIMLAAIPWCVAVLVKVARCWSRDDVYTFSMWDGGLTLRGRALRRPAAAAFGGFALALLGVAVYLLTTWPRVR